MGPPFWVEDGEDSRDARLWNRHDEPTSPHPAPGPPSIGRLLHWLAGWRQFVQVATAGDRHGGKPTQRKGGTRREVESEEYCEGKMNENGTAYREGSFCRRRRRKNEREMKSGTGEALGRGGDFSSRRDQREARGGVVQGRGMAQGFRPLLCGFPLGSVCVCGQLGYIEDTASQEHMTSPNHCICPRRSLSHTTRLSNAPNPSGAQTLLPPSALLGS